MADYTLALKFEKVGDKEAMTSLNLLDQRGRQVVESFAGATGRALGDVASYYTRAGTSIRKTMSDIGIEHEKLIAETVKEEKALERLAIATDKPVAGFGRVRQGLVSLVAQSTGTIPVLDRIGAQFLTMSAGGNIALGVVGGLAAIGLAYKFLAKDAEAAKKAQEEVIKEFDKIAHMDVKGQSEAAALLFSGDPNSKDPKSLAGFSLKELQRQQADFTQRQEAGTRLNREGLFSMSADAKTSFDALKKINPELERRNKLLMGITTPGVGTITAAGTQQAAQDKAGFDTDRIKEIDQQAKEATRAAVERAKDWQKLQVEIAKESAALVTSEVKKLSDENDNDVSANENINRASNRKDKRSGLMGALFPIAAEVKAAEKETKEAIHDSMFALNADIAETIKSNPILQRNKAVTEGAKILAKQFKEEISRALGEGIAAAFETAFSGKGIGNAFKALTATVLSGLGGFMEQLGAQMVVVGIALDAFAKSLLSLDGPAAIAAGVALIAAGAVLKSIAGSFGNSGSSSGGGGVGSGLTSIVDRGTISPNGYSSTPASSITARPMNANYFTIIGPNDPVAQRTIDEINRRNNQRGSLAGA